MTYKWLTQGTNEMQAIDTEEAPLQVRVRFKGRDTCVQLLLYLTVMVLY
jgi:hypothetical protein